METDEFSKENLCKGFTDEMKSAALKKFKINRVCIDNLMNDVSTVLNTVAEQIIFIQILQKVSFYPYSLQLGFKGKAI